MDGAGTVELLRHEHSAAAGRDRYFDSSVAAHGDAVFRVDKVAQRRASRERGFHTIAAAVGAGFACPGVGGVHDDQGRFVVVDTFKSDDAGVSGI